MLHRETLPSSTLDLLIQICAAPEYSAFGLAGGTALALRLGHRISIDLDFFSLESFEASNLATTLGARFPLTVTNQSQNSLSTFVQGVKIDFVTYRYPLLLPIETISGVRLFSLDDITAMKLAALINRGAKKDFYDLDTLISNLGLPSVVFLK